jgi:CRP/FNR family cyclic AMP-dependent transcriptional regulator
MADPNSFTIFRNWSDCEIYSANQTIFAEGQAGDKMYSVLEGKVDIIKQGQLFERLEEGAIFGEMALIDHAPRGASAVAHTACRLAAVTEKRFLFLVQQTPFFSLQVMRVLADRLRRTR